MLHGISFISIDCGSTKDYLDEDTGIQYETDTNFVSSGRNYLVPSSANLQNYRYFGKQLMTLRCFPDGERNCYTLKAEQGKHNKYLIRAFFSYGNYDAKNEPPTFELHLGVNFWDRINLTGSDYVYSEIVYTPSSSDIIHVCLVKTGLAIPCISSLELRPLNTSLYQNPNTSNGTSQPLLVFLGRIDVGSPPLPAPESNRHFKYKDDVYDRIWRCDPKYNSSGWSSLSEAIDVGIGDDPYKLPAQVLGTAARPKDVSDPLTFDYESVWSLNSYHHEYYVYFYFAEIEHGKRTVINITLNSETVLSQPLVLEYLKPVTIIPEKPASGSISFSIMATSESDAPPILNAFEIIQLISDLNPPTYPGDGRIGKETHAFQWRMHGRVSFAASTTPIQGSYLCQNLSSSQLRGEINTSFSYLTELENMDLSHNQLEGHVPEFLAELPKLKFLNLTGNKLSGSIPKALKEKADTTLQLSIADNPDLCMSGSCKRKNNFKQLLIASIIAATVILLIAFGFWIFKRRHKGSPQGGTSIFFTIAVVHSSFKKGGSLKSKHVTFSYSEILSITDNFKTIIGEGGFGKVYFGILQNHMEVAVKLLSPSSTQGYKEFKSESKLLMVVHHRNLVSLIGYCDEGEIKALIYEYMPNGNLHQHLSVKNPSVLTWNERLVIAVDAAQGLDYLHNGCKPPLVHRDLKTTNILLDHNMHGKIADFGLCRAFANDIDSHISTRPAGTLGYVDPEFQRTGNSNKKSDIYSFGIILFELITGQHAVSRAPERNIHILEWVMPILERGDIRNIVDPRLQKEFNINSAWKAVEIALSCISPDAAERPDISEILVELKECLSFDMLQRHFESARTTVELTSLLLDSETVPSPR
ncbi:hypothetical protein RJT34_17170 [Clitoria ternatea]|uniref:non-specific serine/threonine protein kinase n=1 Tax=Clitoria ternatea TaxID=43366 RepID=A0AAN9JAL4_CLITE